MLSSPRFVFALLPALAALAMSFTIAGSISSSGTSVVVSTSSPHSGSASDPGVGLPTPEEVLAECLMKIDMVVFEADEEIAAATVETIAEIDFQRDRGASDGRIRKTASNGRKWVRNEARSAQAELNRIYGDCLINLLRRGADREMVSDMRIAMKGAIRELRLLTNDAYDAINDARDGVGP